MNNGLLGSMDGGAEDGAEEGTAGGAGQGPDRVGKLFHVVGETISRYRMIDEGDHILVGVSGGKDSYVLLDLLAGLQRRSPVHFRLSAFHLDAGWSGHQGQVVARELGERWPDVPNWFDSIPMSDLAHRKLTGSENTPCSFCARVRRGITYSWALKLGCNKVALGHHRDDMIETLLMNMFFNGTIKGMPAILKSSRGPVLIRPLIGVWEDQIRSYAEDLGVFLQTCQCLDSGDGESRRRWAKELLANLEKSNPGIKSTLASSAGRIMPEYLLGHGRVK